MNISEIREKYPQYDSLADQQLAEGLHRKFYSDMDFNEFSKRIGLTRDPIGEDAGVGESLLVGAGAGLTNAGEGIEQLAREGAIAVRKNRGFGVLGMSSDMMLLTKKELEKSVAAAQSNLDSFNEEAGQRREFFDSTKVGQSTSGNVGEFIGEVAPTLLVPGATQRNLGKQILSGVAGGSAIGASQFVKEGQDRGDNAAIGGAISGSLPLPIRAAAKTVGAARDFLAPFLGVKTTNLIKEMGGDEVLKSTAERIDAAKRLGLDFITPAEATGNTLLAKRQGNIGTSEKGFELLNKEGLKRSQKEKEVITNFLEDLSPSGSNANKAIQARTKKILKIERYALSRAARPFYKSAYKQSIPIDKLKGLMNDPVLKSQYEKILVTPAFQREIGKSGLNSIKTIDIVKRSLDDDIEVAKRAGDGNKARIIKRAKDSLLSAADDSSPDYAQARKIFSTGSPSVENLEKGIIGKLASMDRKSLKTVSKTLFDPNETDPKVLSTLRDKLSKGKGKNVWSNIIRNEFERRIEQSATGKAGTTIFKKALEKDRDFKMFLSATKNMPKTNQALKDMRLVFKDLIDPNSVRGAAKLASNSTNVARSSAEFLVNKARDIVSGRRDKVLVEIVTNPQWHKELSKVLTVNNRATRLDRFGQLIGKVSATQADEIN